jgi:superfamily II DNA or RNA helicase
VKKASAAIQRVGRGMRRGATPDVWVADNVPLGHDTLTEHALSRCEAWEGEGYETRVVEQWPEGDDLSDDLLPFLTWT